jgi:hypothetical protein
MTDLNQALTDISSIRRQVARTTQFHGYGPATLTATGLFALGAAALQAHYLPAPDRRFPGYLLIWTLTAALSAALIAVQTLTRTRRIHSGLADEMIHQAVEQFLPSVAAGALLTFVFMRLLPAAQWMLPGLWQIVFSLGVFASCRFLPRPIALAGAWYLLTGLYCLILAGPRALSPWAMGIPFAVGQTLVAAILLITTREGRQ